MRSTPQPLGLARRPERRLSSPRRGGTRRGALPRSARAAGGPCRTARSDAGSADGTAQPGGRLITEGGEPSIASRLATLPSTLGIDSSSPHVYGCCGRANTSSAGPCSTARPAYITITLCAGLGDDAQVVRDQDDADVEVALDLVDQLEDLGLHRHVERGRRLVGDQHRRGCARAPSRSSRAAACRPRTGGGSRARGSGRSGCRRRRAPRRRARGPSTSRRRSCAAPPRRSGRRRGTSGCRQANGSWKIIATSLPRTSRSSAGEAFSRSLPCSRISPLMFERFAFSSPRIARFVTLLPEPDSPTMPSVSPRLEREREPGDRVDEPVLASGTARRDRGRRAAARRSSVPHSRVEEGVHDVDDEVHDDDRERRHEHDRRASPGRSWRKTRVDRHEAEAVRG